MKLGVMLEVDETFPTILTFKVIQG